MNNSKTNINKTTNWQPISQLPLFAALVDKMLRNTNTKKQLLKAVQANKDYIDDETLANMMHAFHRQVANQESITEQSRRWEAARPNAHELGLILDMRKALEEVIKITKKCQALSEEVKYKTAEAINDESKASKSHIIKSSYGRQNNYNLSNEDVKYYKRVRSILKDLYPRVVEFVTKDVIDFGSKSLDINSGRYVQLNTKHELDVLFEYSLYCYRDSGLNVYEKAYNKFSGRYTGEILKAFEASKNGYFAYLDIVEPVGDSGVVVFDRARNKESLMIDIALNKVAQHNHKYYLVSHLIDLQKFIITTGASTPVAIHTEAGLKVQRCFEKYLYLVNKGKVTDEIDAQYVTDMFKIIFHEDITGKVTSEPMPYDEEARFKAIFGDMVH